MTVGGKRADDPERTRNLLLMALTVASGSVDAMSFLALGNVFTGFMTGNMIFLGLIISGAGTQNIVNVCVSLVLFGAGVFLATRIVKPTRGSGTWPGRMTAALGVTAVAQALFLVVWLVAGGPPSDGVGGIIVLLIALWAFGMGVQTAAVWSLRLPGIFTTAATATWAVFISYLVGDRNDDRPPAIEMQLPAGVLISLIIGAIIGGLLLTFLGTYAPVFPLVVTVVVVATAATTMGKTGAVEARNLR